MIDTIALSLSKLPDWSVEELIKNEDTAYTFSAKSIRLSQSGRDRVRATGWNSDNTIYFSFDEDGKLNRIEANLPKMLDATRGAGKPTNGIQIKTPEELNAAVAALLMEVRKFRSDIQLTDLAVARLDLVLNLNLNPREVLPIHRLARHPRVRRETEAYSNLNRTWKPKLCHPFEDLNTVRFGGVKTVICLYDKVRQILSKKGKDWPDEVNCTRVEVQLKKKQHIADLFDLSESKFLTLDQLNFQNCYHTYRNVLCQFNQMGRIPKFACDQTTLIAILELTPESWHATGGIRPLDWYRQAKGVSRKTFNAMRRKVGHLVMEQKAFHWDTILPPHQLPDLVDVDRDGREQFIPSPWSMGPPSLNQ
ncbi:MAG: hypothetical protein ACPGFB_11050 [Verrucomicrobiales bacterium]